MPLFSNPLRLDLVASGWFSFFSLPLQYPVFFFPVS